VGLIRVDINLRFPLKRLLPDRRQRANRLVEGVRVRKRLLALRIPLKLDPLLDPYLKDIG